MKLMNVKGTFDFMPEDMQIRNKIMEVLRRNFEKSGYLPLETPMLNYFDLLSYKYSEDAEILSEIYLDTKVLKKGIEKLGSKQIKELLTILTNSRSEIVKKIKIKIFASDEILPIILNKMDNYDIQEYIKKMDYSLDDNSIVIIVRMLFDPSNLNIIVKKINILDLLVQDNKEEQLYIIEILLITKELEQILIDAYPEISFNFDNYQ